MFRILGFIVGSALSIAGIFLVLGVPEFHLSTFETDQARFDAALEKVRKKRAAVKQAAEDFMEEIAEEAGDIPTETVPSATASTPFHNAEDQAADAAVFAEAQDVFIAEQHWHEFWNPFRSEIAARGFVSQLEKVTGLDYRIVKVKAGVYQVGFAYLDENERRTKISHISAATGLDLPQSW